MVQADNNEAKVKVKCGQRANERVGARVGCTAVMDGVVVAARDSCG